MSDYILDKPFNCGGQSFDAFTVVVPSTLVSATASLEVVPGVAAPAGLLPIGIVVDNTDYTDLGQNVNVRLIGIHDAIAGAAITPSNQDSLTWDSEGRVIPIPATTGFYPCVGIAQEGCTTVGDRVSVLVHPHWAYHV
jgi:hypothetical protein